MPKKIDYKSRDNMKTLWVGMILSTVCTIFFAMDVFGDIVLGKELPNEQVHNILELVIVIISTASFSYHCRELLLFTKRQSKMSDQVRVASGEFSEVIRELFEQWKLSPSEKEVAILLIKGLSFAEIAEARNAKEGTVKAQSNAVYRKADVKGARELLALLFDELLSDVSVTNIG